MVPLKALGGTSDIFPEESSRWQSIEKTAREILTLYGYQEIRTPLIEEAAVFTSSLGDAAEIVTKQMYLFQDRGGRSVALRPEGTACVVRAFIERGLDKTGGLTRFYYLGPMFRAERPQAGRRRQFHQIGVEVFGSASPYQDAEVILLLTRLLKGWGLEGFQLNLNSIGCKEDRTKILHKIREALSSWQAELCPDCKGRLGNNPLRILDCKEPGCQKVSAGIDLFEMVCESCRRHFDSVAEALKGLHLPFERDPHLVRGLDYYTRTAFEVIHPGLGAQNALGGGGRYDELVERMGGASVPAVGFAIGLERVLMAASGSGPTGEERRQAPQVFVASVSPAQIPEALALAEELRGQGVRAFVNLEERPLKRQLEQASKSVPSGFALILGEDEIAQGVVTVRAMKTGQQEQLNRSELLGKILRK
ncbi:MAG: histidine--tRNA ligase [Candidatus Omnitrophica bacterium]|nr:histidine--tRNA ligase [Candidatus Omnitrophota bacterium]